MVGVCCSGRLTPVNATTTPQVDDLSAVYELGEEVFTLSNLKQVWSEAEVIDLFGSDRENCYVAEAEGEVVGFVLGTTIEKKGSSCTLINSRVTAN